MTTEYADLTTREVQWAEAMRAERRGDALAYERFLKAKARRDDTP